MKKSDARKLKVLTVVGTRPEIIRLSAVLAELDRTVHHVLVHTGQNYDHELSEIFFKDLGLRKPDYFLAVAGGTPAEAVANAIARTDSVLAQERPDAFLVLGDTNSCLSAYAAKRRKIPIFHMEAGNRCFDARVPEEINRRIIDHMSDVNLVYSDLARTNLLREGLPPDRIIKTGSPLWEVFEKHRKQIASSRVRSHLGLKKKGYIVLSAHREENIGIPANYNGLLRTIEAVADAYRMPIIFSAHPRTRGEIETRKTRLPRAVKVLKPLGLFDYLRLEQDAFCTLSDSGTISEESSIFGFPAVNLREAHERPEAMDEAAVIMAGLNPERVLQAIAVATALRTRGTVRTPADYLVPDVSKKVVRLILSYTDYVKRVVWSE